MDINHMVKNDGKSTIHTGGRERTKDVKSRLGLSFESFGLKENLLKGIVAKSYFEPTPVQEESIPQILLGKSALIRSKNGTGKTATYLIPLLNMVNQSIPHIQALVLLPTREVVIQTERTANELAKYMSGVNAASFVGGLSIKDDKNLIRKRKPLIAVSTVNRFEHLIYLNKVDPQFIKYLVLDEADQLILKDNGLSLTKIMQSLKNPQIILISATFPSGVSHFQEKYMNNSVQVNLMDELTLIGITQYRVYLTEEDKLSCLNTLLHKLNINQCIIFCNSVKRVTMLAERLNSLGYPALAIHAKMPQNERTRIFNDFRNEKSRYMVSSDLCSRGIDVQNVNVVINFDMPRKSALYLHRIGRSGRYGNYGISISMLTNAESKYLKSIEQELNTNIEPAPAVIPESLYVS